MSVLLNGGVGTFAAAVANVIGDGKLDVLTASVRGGAVSVYDSRGLFCPIQP